MAAISTRDLTITLAGEERDVEVFDVRIEVADAESGDPTYAEAKTGGAKEYRVNGTAVQDMGADTIWTEIFDNAGTSVAYTMRPYGNTAPSVSQPHLTGNCILALPDGVLVGGTADSGSGRQTFEFSFLCTAKPTKVTGA